ncbi:protein psiQ-like isoform X2 [Lucilia cuprina]|uniref:protein psiQ-like isoform X2 n=1 Tax=Lucilia cuprina TaxID=7375 RepID=UPI001F061C15|nr:protein psiQ-like isoform X2 [Lucilia cuprina]
MCPSVAGITRRGCLSRLFPSRYCPEPCARCKKSLCNRDVFPTDRLRCYQCSGSSCVNVEKKPELILPCPFYKEDDRCFTNVLHVSNVIRGCETTMVDANNCPHACFKCNYNGCNKEPGMTEQNCLQCTHSFASPNPSCWRGQDERSDKCVTKSETYCQNKNLYGHVGKCYTHVNEQTGVVQRGCSSNKPWYPSGSIIECYGEKCNTDCLTISCNVCSSDDNPKCMQGKFLKTERCKENTQSCFTCESGNLVTRGCADEKFYERYGNASIAGQQACYLCRDANGCNHTPVRTCYSCSSIDNRDCSLMTSPLYIARRNCSSYDDLCVSTVITKAKHTYVLRGCSSHLAECTNNDPLCVRCNGSLCNTIPIDLSLNEDVQLPLIWDKNGEGIIDGKSGGIRKVSQELKLYLISIVLFNFLCNLK